MFRSLHIILLSVRRTPASSASLILPWSVCTSNHNVMQRVHMTAISQGCMRRIALVFLSDAAFTITAARPALHGLFVSVYASSFPRRAFARSLLCIYPL